MCEIVKSLNEKLIAALEENVQLRKENLKLQESLEHIKDDELKNNQQKTKKRVTVLSFVGKSSKFTEFLNDLIAEQEAAAHGRA